MIAFQSNLEGQLDIYVIAAAGGKLRRITSDPAFDLVPSFPRAGQWIYFSSNRTGDYQIWKVPARGGEAVQVTRNGGFQAIEGTDGTYLYYIQEPGGPSALWRVPTSGGQAAKLLDGVILRAFAVLEQGVYYIEQPAGEARLQYFDFATRSSTTIARSLGEVANLLTVSPDGRTILYTKVDSPFHDLMLVENFR